MPDFLFSALSVKIYVLCPFRFLQYPVVHTADLFSFRFSFYVCIFSSNESVGLELMKDVLYRLSFGYCLLLRDVCIARDFVQIIWLLLLIDSFEKKCCLYL